MSSTLNVFRRKWTKVKPFIYLSFNRYLYINVHLSTSIYIQAYLFRTLNVSDKIKLFNLFNLLPSRLVLEWSWTSGQKT